MFKLLLILGLLLSTSELISLEYGLFAKKTSLVPITKLTIYSERCSGSNYIESLILQNFDLFLDRLCGKHFPPWFELPPEHYLGDPKCYTFEGTDDYLFIIIFRNPYDWVRSFYDKPHHANTNIKKLLFSEFIRAPWELNYKNEVVKRQTAFNPLMDRNPADGTLFKNVLELRAAKIRNMLLIKDRAKNVYYINYETARDNPQKVLKEIENIFMITANSTYLPVIYYKGKEQSGIFKKKKYVFISPQDLEHLNSQLNKDLEKEIGYEIMHDPDEVDSKKN